MTWIGRHESYLTGRDVHPHLSDTVQRAVSIHFDESPKVAALLDGISIETSLGFSRIEGIPSVISCGDLDPTIVLMLRSSGVPLDQIETMLNQQSGFTALLGHPTSFSAVLSEPTAHARTARQFLYYKLPEAIGTAIAALGDLDALVFTSSNLTQAMPFIEKICSGLELLHIQYDSTQENIRNGMHKLSSEASSIQVFGLQYDRWNILAEAVRLAQAPDATN